MRHPGRAGGDQPLRRKSKPTWLHALSVQGPLLPFKCFECQFYPSTAHIQKSIPTLHVPLNEFSMNRAVEPPPDQEREPRSHVHRPLL